MKRFKSIFILSTAAVLLGTTSCENLLQVDPTSQNVILADSALVNSTDLQEMVNSCYDVFRSGKFYGGKLWLLPELMSDHIDGRLLQGGWASVYRRNTNYFNGDVNEVWSEGFLPVYRANFMNEHLDRISDLTAEDRTRIEGEISFIRAVSYWELSRLYCLPYGYTSDNSHLGLPIRKTTGIEAVDRSTLAETYRYIIEQFEIALQKLPEENGIYASKNVVKAYLAKVYFGMNDFAKAYDYANQVITSGMYVLETTPEGRFTQGAPSSESIFSLISTGAADNSASGHIEYYRSDINRPAIIMSEEAFKALNADTADLRKNWLSEKKTSVTEYYFNKYNGRSFFNTCVISLTELKLIRAESAGELDQNLATGIQDVNDIRTRSGLSPISGGTSAFNLINYVRLERRNEFMGEGGLRYHDLRRIGAATKNNLSKAPVNDLKIRGVAWDCPGLTLSLPQSELNGNQNLINNELGGCN